MICPYCGNTAKFVAGDVVYPHRPDLKAKKFYLCKPCDAYVGCHDGTKKPFGRMANAAQRASRRKAHASFDQLWQSGMMRRSHAYQWLAQQLGVTGEKCHIGDFDEATCDQVVEACEKYIKQRKMESI